MTLKTRIFKVFPGQPVFYKLPGHLTAYNHDVHVRIAEPKSIFHGEI